MVVGGFAKEKVGRGGMPGRAGMDERVGGRLVCSCAVGLEPVGGRLVCSCAVGLELDVGGLLRLT